MKISIVLLATTFLSLIVFPTITVGRYMEGWPNPSETFTNEMMFSNNLHSFNYGDSKIWKCVFINGSGTAISITYPGSQIPTFPFPSTPSPTPPTPKVSPTPPTPKVSPTPPTPKVSPTPPTPKVSPTPPTPKKSPSTPSTPSFPPPTPKKSPSPPPSHDHPSTPSNPPPEHHHNHYEYPSWEHINSCLLNIGPVGLCRVQMELSYNLGLFRVSNYCCNLVTNMRTECESVAFGFFTDPYFVPLVRYTCHVNN